MSEIIKTIQHLEPQSDMAEIGMISAQIQLVIGLVVGAVIIFYFVYWKNRKNKK